MVLDFVKAHEEKRARQEQPKQVPVSLPYSSQEVMGMLNQQLEHLFGDDFYQRVEHQYNLQYSRIGLADAFNGEQEAGSFPMTEFSFSCEGWSVYLDSYKAVLLKQEPEYYKGLMQMGRDYAHNHPKEKPASMDDEQWIESCEDYYLSYALLLNLPFMKNLKEDIEYHLPQFENKITIDVVDENRVKLALVSSLPPEIDGPIIAHVRAFLEGNRFPHEPEMLDDSAAIDDIINSVPAHEWLQLECSDYYDGIVKNFDIAIDHIHFDIERDHALKARQYAVPLAEAKTRKEWDECVASYKAHLLEQEPNACALYEFSALEDGDLFGHDARGMREDEIERKVYEYAMVGTLPAYQQFLGELKDNIPELTGLPFVQEFPGGLVAPSMMIRTESSFDRMHDINGPSIAYFLEKYLKNHSQPNNERVGPEL